MEIDGIMYHLNADGYADSGLLYLDGKTYYFHANGAMHYGWLDLDGDVYFMTENGTAAVGRVMINGVYYVFNNLGVLTGSTTIPADSLPGELPDKEPTSPALCSTESVLFYS